MQPPWSADSLSTHLRPPILGCSAPAIRVDLFAKVSPCYLAIFTSSLLGFHWLGQQLLPAKGGTEALKQSGVLCCDVACFPDPRAYLLGPSKPLPSCRDTPAALHSISVQGSIGT